MKPTWIIAMALLLVLAGCQKPTEVQLTDESPLDVEDVLDPDASFDRAAVDTTALLPREQQSYAGFLTVTSIRTDVPSATRRTVLARAVVEDKQRILTHGGRRMFVAFPLGRVRVNNLLLIPRERFLGTSSAGFEYVRELSDFAPGQQYVFSADSLGSAAIEAPDVVTIETPVSGQIVQRDRDLPLQWQGRGNVQIIISSFTMPGRIVPLLRLRPRVHSPRAVVPQRILAALPRGVYVFTFVIARRDERPLTGRFSGVLLLQASSVHNIMVDLR